MIATLLSDANTNLIKLQKQMMPFLKLLTENAIDIQDCQSWQLMGKLMHRSEIFILESRKLLTEFGKLRKHNLEIKRKIIENGEFIDIQALLSLEEWFIKIDQALDNYYTDYEELDKLIIQYVSQ